MLIDTHCHIYLPEFDEDRNLMIERAEKEQVEIFLMPAIDGASHPLLLETEQRYTGKAFAMMGLHPCSVNENYEEELRMVKAYLENRTFIAVGEIGLDYYWEKKFIAEQKDAMRRQIKWALEYDLPVVIHSRDAMDDCIALVREQQHGHLRGVFHCFSGTLQQAKQIIDLGFYLGIGGVVTFKNAGVDKVVEQLDLEHIVLETDAPYLAPVPFRGKRNECSYLSKVALKLAELKEGSIETISAKTTANAKKLFGL